MEDAYVLARDWHELPLGLRVRSPEMAGDHGELYYHPQVGYYLRCRACGVITIRKDGEVPKSCPNRCWVE